MSQTKENPDIVLGIDLGTTYCAMAVVDRFGKSTVVVNSEGQATTTPVIHTTAMPVWSGQDGRRRPHECRQVHQAGHGRAGLVRSSPGGATRRGACLPSSSKS